MSFSVNNTPRKLAGGDVKLCKVQTVTVSFIFAYIDHDIKACR